MEQNILKYHAFAIDKLFKDMNSHTRTQTVTINIDLTHINEDLNGVDCEVEYEEYSGTNNTDDPSTIEILSIKLTNPEECPALAGQEINIDPIIEKQIMKRLD